MEVARVKLGGELHRAREVRDMLKSVELPVTLKAIAVTTTGDMCKVSLAVPSFNESSLLVRFAKLADMQGIIKSPSKVGGDFAVVLDWRLA